MSKKNSRRVESDVQSRIAESAHENLDFLVDRRCDRKYLMDLLEYLERCPTTFDANARLTAFPRKTRKTRFNRMRAVAEDIEKLNRSRVSQLCGDEAPLLCLPNLLRAYADFGEAASEKLQPRKHLTARIVKSLLVSHVIQKTGKKHDKQVSSLISAALDDPDYDEVNHGQWRRENAPLINWVSAKFKNFLYLPKMN